MNYSSFTGAKGKTKPARRVEVLPPSAFADTYKQRPSGPIRIGLRLVSEAESAIAQGAAAVLAAETHPNSADAELWLETYNNSLICDVLARVCCEADDVSKAYFAPAPESLIRAALAPGGIRRLWESYQLLAIEEGVLHREATDEEMKALGIDDSADAPADKSAARKLFAAALDRRTANTTGAP